MVEVKYVQIMLDIKKKIEQGILKPGDMLQSEKALSEEYNLSRMTVRKGLTLLSERGYITSVPGKGYFVNKPATGKYVFSFDETEFIEKYVSSVKLQQANIVKANDILQKELEVDQNTKIIMLGHIFLREDKAIAYDVKYFPYTKGDPFIESQIGYATYPLKALQNSNAFSQQRQIRISTALSDEYIQKIMKLDKPHALMVIEQKYRDLKNNTLMWGKIHILQDYAFLEGESVF
ncbi:MAG: GntR family transcriptional regulator [Clostridiales bacterium]|nr:GntR family transcriptional regulator [Clostridiales bacterium]